MNRTVCMSRCRVLGFSLVELLVTLALVGVAAAVVLPLQSVVEQRAKEVELRDALRTVRRALDEYKAAADAGIINKPTGTSGYPLNLDVLVDGVPRSSAATTAQAPLRFLRRIPRDPFFLDRSVPDAKTWRVRSYASPPGEFTGGADVFDISSGSERLALDGSRLADW